MDKKTPIKRTKSLEPKDLSKHLKPHKKPKRYKYKILLFLLTLTVFYICLRFVSYQLVSFESHVSSEYDAWNKANIEKLAIANGYTKEKHVSPPKGFTIKRQIITEMKRIGVRPVYYPFIRSLIKAESDDDPLAESSAGCIGLGQIHPSTAKKYGYKIQEMYDPVKNIRVTVAWFREMLASQKNDVLKALHEYNSGIERMYKTEENRQYPSRVFMAMYSLSDEELSYNETEEPNE